MGLFLFCIFTNVSLVDRILQEVYPIIAEDKVTGVLHGCIQITACGQLTV